MRVHDSFPFHEGATREFLNTELFKEGMVDVRRCDVKHVLLHWVLIVKICVQVLSDVLAKFGKDLPSIHVPASFNLDHLLVLEILKA
jgi:hypothetical protein